MNEIMKNAEFAIQNRDVLQTQGQLTDIIERLVKHVKSLEEQIANVKAGGQFSAEQAKYGDPPNEKLGATGVCNERRQVSNHYHQNLPWSLRK